MLVKEMMTKDVTTVSPESSLKEVGDVIKEKRISGLPVVGADGDVVGVVTLTDLLGVLDRIYKWKALEKKTYKLKISDMLKEEKTEAKVKDIMAKDVLTLREDSTLEDVMRVMFERGAHTIPITKEGKLVGVIGKRDLIRTYF